MTQQSPNNPNPPGDDGQAQDLAPVRIPLAVDTEAVDEWLDGLEARIDRLGERFKEAMRRDDDARLPEPDPQKAERTETDRPAAIDLPQPEQRGAEIITRPAEAEREDAQPGQMTMLRVAEQIQASLDDIAARLDQLSITLQTNAAGALFEAT